MRYTDMPEDFDGHENPLGHHGDDLADSFSDSGVRARLAMELEGGPGLSYQLRADVEYRTADPLVLGLTFHLPGDTPVTWTVSRELLLDGLSAPAGEGDVRVRPHPDSPDHAQLQLHAPGGSAHLSVTRGALHEVLLRTDLLVPFGEEFTDGGLERAVAGWLEAAASEN
ncbi:SsgA family sporulation/cell division regulator [Kitasatospora sp. McL0602]|uniref:SsgA family sporulation/cell division regulator n=1 Tax=Kitasatospora sp. McL0602 TaxID=3439530 RepID=UPI003F8AE246